MTSVRARGLKWNSLDSSVDPPVNRVSHTGEYEIFEGLPRFVQSIRGGIK
jgi:hypothetical protein